MSYEVEITEGRKLCPECHGSGWPLFVSVYQETDYCWTCGGMGHVQTEDCGGMYNIPELKEKGEVNLK